MAMAVISLEDVNRIIAENDPTHREAERQVRQVQERQQASNNQADWAAPSNKTSANANETPCLALLLSSLAGSNTTSRHAFSGCFG
jgi:hypothetical protein